MDVKDLHIGVIGVGGRGWLSAYAHDPENGVRLVAGADPNERALARFRERYGPDVMTTADYREIIARDDIEAVFVTSPDFLHEEQALAALQAGKHVYLEKPMAITIEGCDRLLAAAMATGAKLYLGHNMRHMDVIIRMKEVIDAGGIGEVKAAWCRHFVSYGGDAYFKDWHSERAKTTGLLLQKGAHDIDVLHWLCGGYSRRVVGMGGLTLYDRVADRRSPETPGDPSFRLENWPPLAQTGFSPVIDVEDVSMMLMELDNGVFASYQQCHYTPDAWRNYTIIGSEGRIENFGDGDEDTVIRVWNRRCYYKPDGDEVIPAPPPEGSHGGADPRIVAEFVRFVREGGSISTSPIAARYAVAAGCQATASLRSGSVPMDVPPVSNEVARYFGDTR